MKNRSETNRFAKNLCVSKQMKRHLQLFPCSNSEFHVSFSFCCRLLFIWICLRSVVVSFELKFGSVELVRAVHPTRPTTLELDSFQICWFPTFRIFTTWLMAKQCCLLRICVYIWVFGGFGRHTNTLTQIERERVESREINKNMHWTNINAILWLQHTAESVVYRTLFHRWADRCCRHSARLAHFWTAYFRVFLFPAVDLLVASVCLLFCHSVIFDDNSVAESKRDKERQWRRVNTGCVASRSNRTKMTKCENNWDTFRLTVRPSRAPPV